jgi:hypothetical protein
MVALHEERSFCDEISDSDRIYRSDDLVTGVDQTDIWCVMSLR